MCISEANNKSICDKISFFVRVERLLCVCIFSQMNGNSGVWQKNRDGERNGYHATKVPIQIKTEFWGLFCSTASCSTVDLLCGEEKVNNVKNNFANFSKNV